MNNVGRVCILDLYFRSCESTSVKFFPDDEARIFARRVPALPEPASDAEFRKH
jgi:hypothetical protein